MKWPGERPIETALPGACLRTAPPLGSAVPLARQNGSGVLLLSSLLKKKKKKSEKSIMMDLVYIK